MGRERRTHFVRFYQPPRLRFAVPAHRTPRQFYLESADRFRFVLFIPILPHQLGRDLGRTLLLRGLIVPVLELLLSEFLSVVDKTIRLRPFLKLLPLPLPLASLGLRIAFKIT
jgi:hypothetical protein